MTDPVSTPSRWHQLIGLDELPLDPNTRVQLEVWLNTLKTVCGKKNLLRFPTPESYEAFDREGIELWKKVRQELASNYDVFYYSTRLAGLFKHPDAPMVKRIRLGAEYSCWATWYVDDVGCFDPVKLPISQETLERLNKWQDVFDDTLDHDYPPDSRFPSEEVAKIWSREGIRLWVQLQRELSAEYEVLKRIYHQEKTQLMKLDDWINAYREQYQQDDIDNSSQRLL
ncbi:hypothetical protein [Leptolyngbya sp. FACHB-711]|uniref:hypothetical protein n=1 Tax=unclassified Leptolyngbya TaxID=2650499 RepID=UPI001688C37C|nr:hypothetical protein [Leptolyngbya sp. FACHB-711]MBD1850926.1 hypothetical protein [Cyanobacteria bacterium FACHB-502]MBD2024018.1 hypothetical protein [Leptolyngbya sp. FACHB-711]